MANKKKTSPLALVGYEIDNKIMSEIKKATIASSIQFRNDIFESQNRINYQNESIYYKVLNDYVAALHPNAKAQMKELQNKARQSLKGETHNIYRTTF